MEHGSGQEEGLSECSTHAYVVLVSSDRKVTRLEAACAHPLKSRLLSE